MPERTPPAIDRLPQHAAAIRERMLADREFRSLCEDHGVALEALRRWQLSDDRHRQKRITEFEALVAALEQDILHELNAN